MTAPAAVPVVTLACDVEGCAESFDGPAEGAGSAKWKLASHRYRIHGIKADGSRRPAAGKGAGKRPKKESARPAVAVLRDVVEPLDEGTGPPSEDALTKAAGHALQLASLTAASIAAETEDGLTDPERDQIVGDLALSTTQAREIARPLAHAFQPTKINKRFGRAAVENVDAFAAVLEIGELAIHWRRYFRQRRQRQINLGGGVTYLAPAPDMGPPMPAEAPHNPGGTAVPAEVIETSGTGQSGHVVTADEVERLRSRSGRP